MQKTEREKNWNSLEKVTKNYVMNTKNTCSTHSFLKLNFFFLKPCDYWGSCKRFTKKNWCYFVRSRNHCFCLLIHKLSLFTVKILKNRNVCVVVVVFDVSCYEKFLSAVQSNIRFSCRTLRTCVDLKTKQKKEMNRKWMRRKRK